MTSIAALLSREIAALGKSSPSPRADAAILLAHAIERPREWLVANGEAEVPARDADRFRSLCERRRNGVPVAYLTGSAWFYGREFVVNESVLVPRPETEHLIDEALEFIKNHNGKGPGEQTSVLDIGLGSGAIACTIAAETGLTVDGTEISRSALTVAKKNAVRLGITKRCRFWFGALAQPVGLRTFDLVIANLPYVPTANLPANPEPASFEPAVALDGGPDGLSHYRKLLFELPTLLNPKSLILLECAPPTIKNLAELIRTSLPGFVIEECSDYAGLPRYVKALDRRPAELRTGEAARSHGGRERG